MDREQWGYLRAIARSSLTVISINHPSNFASLRTLPRLPLLVPFNASNCSNSPNPLDYWVSLNVPDSPEHLDEHH
jgi:hypothetical protein